MVRSQPISTYVSPAHLAGHCTPQVSTVYARDMSSLFVAAGYLSWLLQFPLLATAARCCCWLRVLVCAIGPGCCCWLLSDDVIGPGCWLLGVIVVAIMVVVIVAVAMSAAVAVVVVVVVMVIVVTDTGWWLLLFVAVGYCCLHKEEEGGGGGERRQRTHTKSPYNSHHALRLTSCTHICAHTHTHTRTHVQS